MNDPLASLKSSEQGIVSQATIFGLVAVGLGWTLLLVFGVSSVLHGFLFGSRPDPAGEIGLDFAIWHAPPLMAIGVGFLFTGKWLPRGSHKGEVVGKWASWALIGWALECARHQITHYKAYDAALAAQYHRTFEPDPVFSMALIVGGFIGFCGFAVNFLLALRRWQGRSRT